VLQVYVISKGLQGQKCPWLIKGQPLMWPSEDHTLPGL